MTVHRTPSAEVQWIDAGREPTQEPDAEYPDGIDIEVVDVLLGGTPTRYACKIALEYPAKRCGYYLVKCRRCGRHDLISTAGRADDPRSVTLPCLSAVGAS